MHDQSPPILPETVSDKRIKEFQATINTYYAANGRKLPWRDTSSPYRILVSEFMLQQTQVDRVLLKYDEFIARFPDIGSLACAHLRDILAVWQGLGYNRRAANLHRTAQRVVQEFNGTIPDCADTLRQLPGIGQSTAGALLAFAFNKPAVFIETNIRRVFIHFFFPDTDRVSDKHILPLVQRALDTNDPRSWYYALMDYGVMLARRETNPNRRSTHHHRQSPFENSDRQIRGMILKTMVEHPSLPREELVRTVPRDPKRTDTIIDRLLEEGLLASKANVLSIPPGSRTSPGKGSDDPDQK